MKSTKTNVPIYKQLIRQIELGYELLDEDSQKEIQIFIAGRQHTNGGFIDRGGEIDLYYSLFGFWLSSALKLRDQLFHLNSFILNKKEEKGMKMIDEFALSLIKTGLSMGKSSRSPLLKSLITKNNQLNLSYQLFLFSLVFDARNGRKVWLDFLSCLFLRYYRIPAGAPCSMVAALMVAKHELKMNINSLGKQLLSYFDENKGFKAFEHVENGDMLSTSVALFALQKVGFDIRLIAPTCYKFIQHNYSCGAFMSGDGDETRDLEYTFYGLLALGSLVGENVSTSNYSEDLPPSLVSESLQEK